MQVNNNNNVKKTITIGRPVDTHLNKTDGPVSTYMCVSNPLQSDVACATCAAGWKNSEQGCKLLKHYINSTNNKLTNKQQKETSKFNIKTYNIRNVLIYWKYATLQSV